MLTNTYDNGTLKISKEVTADADGSSREEIVTTYNNDLTVASSVITTTITEDSTSATTIERSAYTYDAFGNVITSQTSSTDKDNTETVSVSNYQYDLLGRNTVITDGEGKVNEEYTYDPLGNVIYQNVNDSRSRSVYNAYSRLIQQIDDEDYKLSSDGLNAEVKTDSYSDLSAGHRYVYAENGNLASETNRLGVTTTYDYYPNSSDVKTESFDIYVFTYDQKGNTTKVTVSGETYADYAYNSEDNPTLVSYGNGQSVRYEYDAHNNLIAQYHNDDTSAYVVYTYKVIENTADSETAENTDTDYSSEFEQDPEVTINTNEEYTLASKVNYDTSRATYYDGDTVTVKSIADDGTETVIYSYSNSETENSRTVTDTYQSGATVTMTTDIDSAVDTFTQSGTGSLATFTSYSSEMDENTNTATSYIKNADGNTIITSNMTYDDNGNVISEEFILNGSTITYTYTYDDKGRMTSCDYGNGSKSEYAYDANGALIKYNEIYNDNGTKYLYEYDSRGNLNKWIITGLADESGTDADAGITTYETNNQIWLDGITLVDYGEEEYRYTTDYDGSGNPDSYVDYRYDWSSGRNLESVSSTATGTEKLVSRFTYDEKGIRASKISSAGNKNEYLTKDGRITSEYVVNNRGKISSEIVYLYDSNDNLIGFNNQNSTCFYVRNYMGDVMGIVDSDGVWLEQYQYDAWGKLISSRKNDEDFESVLTPARKSHGNNMLYRGYYYDTATEMYYLQSRYYSPDQFRFLNPDLPEYAKELKDEYAGTNLFAYCQNNPIGYIDYNGYWGKSVHNGYNKSAKSAYRTTVKGGFYYYGTYFWALECGFSIENAKLLGEYCQELDKKYPSSMYAKVWLATSGCPQSSYSQSQLSEYRRWQYFHFNKNKSGQDSRTSFCLSRRNWAVDKWNQGQYRKALNYLGYAIHAVQDYHSHGQIGRGLDIPQHIAYDEKNNPNKRDVADNINYVWADSGWKLLEYDSYNKTRLVRTGIETKKFINVFLSRIKNRHMIKGKI